MEFKEYKKRFSEENSALQNCLLIDETKAIKDSRSYEKDGKWYVFPIAITPKQVYIVCPFCGQIHLHGYTPDKNGNSGFRRSHCKTPSSTSTGSTYHIGSDDYSKAFNKKRSV